jgi:DNA-3-methyladenine glycosylase II
MTATRDLPRRHAQRVFELRPRPPFRLDFTVWALRRRAQNAIDRWDGRCYRRALLVDGESLQLAVSQLGTASVPRLEVTLSGPRVGPASEAEARVTLARLLGLDVDLSDFYARAVRDRPLAELAERYRGVKPPRFPTIFECLVNAVACQQLSLAAGLTLVNRLAGAARAQTDKHNAFPAPSDVLGLSRSALRTLGFSRRKAETITELANAAAAGKLELDVFEQLDDAAIVDTLVQTRGIGRWSADYVLLRGLGRLHVFPRGDSGALAGLRRFLAGTELVNDPDAALARWAPDAGLVYFHLLLRGLEREVAALQSHETEMAMG